ncbi:hypothetical protein O988_07195, partial [Pseudogymnoascus sp. VKM F-3808]
AGGGEGRDGGGGGGAVPDCEGFTGFEEGVGEGCAHVAEADYGDFGGGCHG